MALSLKAKCVVALIVVAAAVYGLRWHFRHPKALRRFSEARPALGANQSPSQAQSAGEKAKSTRGKPIKQRTSAKCDFANVRYFVLFAGHSRSGHTLVSALLDAHPHVVISNEYDLLKNWYSNSRAKNAAFLTRKNVFDTLYAHAQEDARHGRGREYSVPGEWAGQCRDGYAHVIGDKKGFASANFFVDSIFSKLDAVRHLRDVIGLPFRVIHVIRNPYDNIATQTLRYFDKYYSVKKSGGSSKFDNETALIFCIRRYFRLVDGYRNFVQARLDNFNFLDIHLNDFESDPTSTMKRLCDWLELDCSKSYVKHCTSIVFTNPSKTRKLVAWSTRAKNLTETMMRKYSFLQRYIGTF
ncbi:uncharacterized protein [Oscarella lobularis]|uniref:uncharacterized protein n=1 Tax=Oscarella lobularis TaxID=121494 RepID=UPI0033144C47